MSLPPLNPIFEEQRLQELRRYDVLDSPPEQVFDRIALLATRLFEVPIALVSMIDTDRQWFKACFGVDLRQTSRDLAFCAHAILQDRVMVVRDAREDNRFKDNPFVTGEPHVRFYAGAPLKSPLGVNLGTLCVIDTKPREFTAASEETLADLAAIVVDELELRIASRQLRQEVEERKTAEARLAELATKDPLTGLSNRNGLTEKLAKTVKDAAAGIPSGVLYIDLDNFKIVNDSLGHHAGDRLLVSIANLLQRALRKEDLIARFGGDEFVIVVSGESLDGTLMTAERVRERLEAFVFIESGKSFNVGGSVGAVIVGQNTTPDRVLAQADAACYVAKSRGRNRVEVYWEEPEQLEQLRIETNIIGELQEALREDRMELWLQPVVDLQSGCTAAYEALLRMRKCDGSIVLPNSFLPAVARYRLLEEIDRCVVTQSVGLLKKNPKLRLFVNLSASSLEGTVISETIRELFAESQVAPDRAIFEITETEIIRNLQLAQEMIGQLRKLGFRFALDDFGSGLSNFTYLKRLPLDYLKLDGSLIKDLDHDPRDRFFVSAVQGVARNLGVSTIAEFVGNDATVQILKEIGIDFGQGYFFGKSAPAEQVLAAL